MDFVRYTA
jgi:hypothetical protein